MIKLTWVKGNVRSLRPKVAVCSENVQILSVCLCVCPSRLSIIMMSLRCHSQLWPRCTPLCPYMEIPDIINIKPISGNAQIWTYCSHKSDIRHLWCQTSFISILWICTMKTCSSHANLFWYGRSIKGEDEIHLQIKTITTWIMAVTSNTGYLMETTTQPRP